MPFPVTARYFLDFRNSDTGLTPTFTFFQRADTFGATSPVTPAGGIIEKSNGRYYFDWIWTSKNDPDIVFEADGGASIPTEEVRYIKGTLSPRDRFLDEPISQVVTDVWTDSVSYAAGQKGKRVDQLGDPTDLSSAATMFGKELLYKESIRGDSAGTGDGSNVKQVFDRIGAPVGATISADIAGVQTTANTINTKVGTPAGASVSADIAAVKGDTAAIKAKTDNLPADPASVTAVDAARDSVKGAQLLDISQIAGGAAFVPATHNLKAIFDAVGSVATPAGVAAAVWDELLAGHLGAGKAAQALYDAASNTVDNAAIATAVWNKDISAVTGAGLAGKQLNTAANQAQLVDLIFDEPTAGHTTAGTFGKAATDTLAHALMARKVLMGKWKIASFQLTLYDVDGVTPIQVFDLKDDLGNPTNTKVFERQNLIPPT